MAKSIVFFNLADMHAAGLAKTSVDALRRKYQRYSRIYEFLHGVNQVHLIDLFGLLNEHKKPRLINSLSALTAYMPVLLERLAITDLCSKADKIMLGVHGHADDTSNGFAGLGWDLGDGIIGNYKDFAALIGGLLLPGQAYKLALIVCFGARAENFRADHDGALSEEDVRSSFAYKFFKQLCTDSKAKVTMTARTGSVGFDQDTGRSLVQTEVAVAAEIQNQDLQDAEETKRIADNYERLKQSRSQSREEATKFVDWVDRLSDTATLAADDNERIIKAYLNLKSEVNRLQGLKGQDSPKYGKFVYTYDGAVATVYRKYEGGKKVMSVLYTGPL